MPEVIDVTSLPPHLVDPNLEKVAEPADGIAFRPAKEWWYDEKTGYLFESNGYGFFEGVIYSGTCPDGKGGRFEAVSNLFIVRERPGHGLKRCDEGDGSGVPELSAFLFELWNLNGFWASTVITELQRRGVVIVTQNLRNEKVSQNHSDLSTHHPKHTKLVEVHNYSKAIEEEVRQYFKKDLDDPRKQIPDDEKKYLENQLDRLIPLKIKEEERLQQKVEKRQMSTDHHIRYGTLKDKATAAGLSAKRVDETLEAVCKDRKLDAVSLSDEILDDVEGSIDIEIETLAYQTTAAEASEPVTVEATPVEEPAEVKPEMPIEFLKLFDSARSAKISLIQMKLWHKNLVAEGADPYSSEVLDGLNRAVAEYLAKSAEAEVFGTTEPPISQADPEPVSAPVDNVPEASETAPVKAGRRPRKSEEEKAAEAAEKAALAAEKAAKKAEKEAEEKAKNERKLDIADALERIEAEQIVNLSSGEVRTFNEVTKQLFDLKIKDASIDVEKAGYLANFKDRENQIKDHEKGWSYCYGTNVAEKVRAQFEKQKKTRHKEDGTTETYYDPATVTTQYGKFSRNPEDDVICNDPNATKEFLLSLDPATAAFYGDAIRIEYKIDEKAAKALVRDGFEIPGFAINPNPDPIGIPTFALRVHLKNPSYKVELSDSLESKEDSDANLEDSDTKESVA